MTAETLNLCEGCAACCTAFDVKWLGKPPYTPCIHCDNGCNIQDEKPAECSDFDCAYVQMKTRNISLRPDNCGIIFEKLSARIFFGTVILGMKVSDLGLGQTQSFLKQGFSVILASVEKEHNHFMISDSHTEDEIMAEFRELENGYL